MADLKDKKGKKDKKNRHAPLQSGIDFASGDDGCAASEPFALRVLGDSMEPEFKDGCIIIIDPSAPVKHGAFVIANTDDGLIFRQLIVDGENMFLKPLNPGYETQPLPNKRAVTGVIVQRGGARRTEHKHYT